MKIKTPGRIHDIRRDVDDDDEIDDWEGSYLGHGGDDDEG
jgi:hypothetical protein